MKYKFNMKACERAGSGEAHKDYFQKGGVDWATALWTREQSAYGETFMVFTTLDRKCKACTSISFFDPAIEGRIDLKKYM